MRLQLAINVPDLEAAIDFYSRILGVGVNKREPGYANFAVAQPPLKLVLFEAPAATDRLNHLGVEMFDDSDVSAAAERLAAEGIEHVHDEAQVCCFAKQNKVIAHAPDGTMWEWYRVLEDVPARAEQASAAPAAHAATSCACC
jgi:catechol 2,3-dioxygenase-like lactoylglutathione lyase family enzyme